VSGIASSRVTSSFPSSDQHLDREESRRVACEHGSSNRNPATPGDSASRRTRSLPADLRDAKASSTGGDGRASDSCGRPRSRGSDRGLFISDRGEIREALLPGGDQRHRSLRVTLVGLTRSPCALGIFPGATTCKLITQRKRGPCDLERGRAGRIPCADLVAAATPEPKRPRPVAPAVGSVAVRRSRDQAPRRARLVQLERINTTTPRA
jgi:hypothetical protein